MGALGPGRICTCPCFPHCPELGREGRSRGLSLWTVKAGCYRNATAVLQEREGRLFCLGQQKAISHKTTHLGFFFLKEGYTKFCQKGCFFAKRKETEAEIWRRHHVVLCGDGMNPVPVHGHQAPKSQDARYTPSVSLNLRGTSVKKR